MTKKKRRIFNLLPEQREILELKRQSRADPNPGDIGLALSREYGGVLRHEIVGPCPLRSENVAKVKNQPNLAKLTVY